MQLLHLSKYAFRDAFRALFRHKGMAFLTVLTIFITLLIFGMAILAVLNSQNAAKKVEKELEIVAFLDHSVDKKEAESIGDKIKKISGVQSIRFVSREEALKYLNKEFEENRNFNLEDTLGGDNPLPDAYKIEIEKAAQSDAIAKKLEGIPGIQDVNYGQGVVNNFVKINETFKYFALLVILLLVLATIFLINSTISLTVSNRHDEIRIMAIIGASRSFIRAPFFLEGIFIGCVGSLLAVLALFYGYNSFEEYMLSHLPFVPFYHQQEVILGIYLGLIVCGALMGALGSGFAVKKYLKF